MNPVISVANISKVYGGGHRALNNVSLDIHKGEILAEFSGALPRTSILNWLDEHLPDDRKKTLYSEIYELLSEGGVFLNLEHVASETPAGVELFDQYFIDHLFDFHSKSDPAVERSGISNSYYSRPDKNENILALVDEQCEWLRDIGFEDVDCFFKVFELALFGGRKLH